VGFFEKLQPVFLRSTMKKDRLNNYLILHCHKSITDTLNTVDIAKKFVCANEQRKTYFGKYRVEICDWLNDESPHVSKRSAASVIVEILSLHSIKFQQTNLAGNSFLQTFANSGRTKQYC